MAADGFTAATVARDAMSFDHYSFVVCGEWAGGVPSVVSGELSGKVAR
jgi:hypothetical protein